MLTDENGNITERRHFDPWGQPIKIEDGAGNSLDKLTLLDRGYTGHEHLQTIGLIHMNGRLYDPALHRFLQPDNYVQDPFNTQNFNRYGYVLNNPLLYTDPTGEEFISLSTLAVIGISTAIASIAASWDEIKGWVGRNARSTGKWCEKQGRSVGEWFSKQYNSVKGWFEGDGTPRVIDVKPITTKTEFNAYVSNAEGILMQNPGNRIAPYREGKPRKEKESINNKKRFFISKNLMVSL